MSANSNLGVAQTKTEGLALPVAASGSGGLRVGGCEGRFVAGVVRHWLWHETQLVVSRGAIAATNNALILAENGYVSARRGGGKPSYLTITMGMVVVRMRYLDTCPGALAAVKAPLLELLVSPW